jgi:hypothetical protein
MDKPKITPKDFFLWAMAMIALYSSIFALITLLFSYIDHTFPDALNYYVDAYGSGMRIQIATLLVMFPLFLALMRFIRRDIERDPTRKDIWIRRWALYLTVFIAGLSIIVDLIVLVNNFLGGEITMRFILKILVVLGVAGVAFMHFLADIWGYWMQWPNRARYVGWGALALVVATIAAGFVIMGSPAQIRLYRFDDNKVNDLQSIQWQVVNYWQQKEMLPATLADLQDPISGFMVPKDAQTGADYRYEVVSPMSFKLCATFNAETQSNSINNAYSRAVMPLEMGGKDLMSDSWQHGAGETCFERTIDPERYPPYIKQRPPTKGI